MRIRTGILIIILALSIFSNLFAGEYRNIASYYRNQGLVAQEKGKHDEALEHYFKARDYDPTWPIIYNDIGIVYEAKFMMDEAMSMYRKSLEYDSYFAPAYTNLALLAEKKMEYDMAETYFKKRIELGPPNDQWVKLSHEHLKKINMFKSSASERQNNYLSSLTNTKGAAIENLLDQAQSYLEGANESSGGLTKEEYRDLFLELKVVIEEKPCGQEIKYFLKNQLSQGVRNQASNHIEKYYFFCSQGYDLLAQNEFNFVKDAIFK